MTSSTSHSSDTYYENGVFDSDNHFNENSSKPPIDISNNSEVEFVDSYETDDNSSSAKKEQNDNNSSD